MTMMPVCWPPVRWGHHEITIPTNIPGGGEEVQVAQVAQVALHNTLLQYTIVRCTAVQHSQCTVL